MEGTSGQKRKRRFTQVMTASKRLQQESLLMSSQNEGHREDHGMPFSGLVDPNTEGLNARIKVPQNEEQYVQFHQTSQHQQCLAANAVPDWKSPHLPERAHQNQTSKIELNSSQAGNGPNTLSTGALEKLGTIYEQRNILQKKKKQLVRAQRESRRLEIKIIKAKTQSKQIKDHPDHAEDVRAAQMELRRRLSQLHDDSNSLEGQIQMHEYNVQFVTEKLLTKLLEDTCQTDILDKSDSEDNESFSEDAADEDAAELYSISSQDSVSEGPTISASALLRHATAQEVREARDRLAFVQARFDRQSEIYAGDRREFVDLMAEGATNWSLTYFDNQHLEIMRDVTRGLIEAEEYLEEVQNRANALERLSSTKNHQSSEHEHEGSHILHPSQDQFGADSVDRERIGRWRSRLAAMEDVDDAISLVEVDEWDARTVQISDTISMVDHSQNRRRIDRWRASCIIAGKR
ncbi:MAG: hypothetical protein Q9164_001805 [Protoblastenia rupestris]